MEVASLPTIFEAKIQGIKFSLATPQEICKASISDCPISHASQLSNPFLGLPLETGKCESCGTAEAGQCEGHFGYIELPLPIYHPDHIGELKRMLSLLCLKCLKLKDRKNQAKNINVAERIFACCEEASQISIHDAKNSDGAYCLELKVTSRTKTLEGCWNFLERFGFRYGYEPTRPLLASEVMSILEELPQETKRKLAGKGYFPQDGYILQYLPVPPNCLSVPDISDGISTKSTDYSISLLKRVLRQVEIIKNSMPENIESLDFESHEIAANELQAAVTQYLLYRGTGKAARDVDGRFGVKKEINASSSKAWLEKMKTLFIRKGSGFSSRSVITGDPFKGVSEIGLPFEVAQKITFEERVNQHNTQFLQKLVDEKLCLTYTDGQSTYSLREGSKGHTFLRPGQVVRRRIMDGDIVFINRPPTTHKHSFQALSVYIHDDHTLKINPIICGPLSADFDGDCIHLFYPQSLEAKAEVLELFSVEKRLLSSHTGNLNLQLAVDSLLSLKVLFRKHLLDRPAAQQLAMHVSNVLPGPAIAKSRTGSLWTAPQMLQSTLPPNFDFSGDRLVISKSEVLFLDGNRDVMASIVNDIVTLLFFLKGPNEVLRFFNSIQPLLMESLHSQGFSVSLEDLFLTRDVLEKIQQEVQNISPLLCEMRASYSESIALQLDSYLRSVKTPITNFIVKSSAISNLVDYKSESALSKVVQQIGFLGLQISDKGKLYSESLVKDMSAFFKKTYPFRNYPTEEFGLISRPLFQGLDPYQEMVHSIASREVIVRSSQGLTEPGTLFKNLMAILRDVVICHDGTVRNTCSNSIVQFEYGVSGATAKIATQFSAGDPVGVLAATAMSNPAYKAVLDSSPSSNSSWQMMKEILLSGVSFKNVTADRRVLLYLNNCDCGRKHCQENAACIVKNHLKKISLKDTAIEFLIEYKSQLVHENSDINSGLVGHIHLNKAQLVHAKISMHDILRKCQDTIDQNQKKKKDGDLFKRIDLSFSERCSFCESSKRKWTDVPCIQFLWQRTSKDLLEKASRILADTVCPVLFQTSIKGDQRVSTANIIWMTPETATWMSSPSKGLKGELGLDITLEKEAVRKSGDAWRVVMDACLPVIQLIDVHRSIPYAIKQVEDLLGISCAFEQAVQRLSTSVTMVTKGVLKDHFLLLGNSLTCAGTLIGFNAGGIKSLSESLGIEVPFMKATLFTHRKCFERAAEKCNVDYLSSIVGSCAWGKHVSMGTGSPFEIFWDTKKAELNQATEIDVYNFLYMVNGSSLREDMGTGCLGEEIDDLDRENEYMDFDLSPVREDGSEKPTFEDGIEFGLNGNDNDGVPAEDTNDSWADFGKKIDSDENDWGKKAEESAWSKKLESEVSGWGKKSEESVWGKKAESEGNDWVKKAEESGWGKNDQTEVSDLGKKAGESVWGRKDNSDQDNLLAEKADWTARPEQHCWGKKVNTEQRDWTKKPVHSAWGRNNNSREDDGAKLGEQSFSGAEANNKSAWGGKADSGGGNWGEKDDQKNWGNPSHNRDPNEKSGSAKNDHNTQKDVFSVKSDGLSQWETTKDEPSKDSGSGGDKGLKDNSWDDKVGDQTTDSKPLNTWGSSNDWSKFDLDSTASENKESHLVWGQKQSTDTTLGQGWGSSNVDTSSENGGRSQWGRGRGRGRGGRGRVGRGGPTSDGEWKNRRPRPVDPNAPAVFTLTRQRLDLFTAEEQDVLTQMESIMKNIRRVMNQTGYNDGDPLSADDQTYIIDNVFNHHPDKDGKVGAGIAHIMVTRHKEFQDSRCFYVVSVDGVETDFSYRKCLENFIRSKYPDIAETFLPKYFRKPQPRPAGWNRDQGPPGNDAGTPGRWNSDQTPGPGWNKSEAPVDATWGWNKEENPAADEVQAKTSS